ncbi:uncharacterized protein LOC111120948 [Crassostrea virginica]
MVCKISVLCFILATVCWVEAEPEDPPSVVDDTISRLGRTSSPVLPIHYNFSKLHFPHFNFSGLHLNLSALQHLHLSHPITLHGNTQPITLHGNATEHWCCNVATTKKIIQSHSTLIYTKQIKDRVTHHHCGFLGLSRCAGHHYYYVSVPAYKTTYTSKTIETTCPKKNLVCCKGYLLVADNCIPLSAIPDIKDDLIRLQNANIPLGR